MGARPRQGLCLLLNRHRQFQYVLAEAPVSRRKTGAIHLRNMTLGCSARHRAALRFLAKAKLPRLRFHDLRHSHATHMLVSGVHPKIASERLGHATVGLTLDTYSHVIPGMQEDAVARIDAGFASTVVKPVE